MKRDKSFGALLRKIDDEFQFIETEYQACIRAMKLTNSLKVNIFDFLSHNRTILDYLAQEITLYCSLTPKKVYFPIAPKTMPKDVFIKKLNAWFPGLRESRPDIFNYLIEIQHFYGNTWLPEFNKLVINYKHIDFAPQSTSGYASIFYHFKGVGKPRGSLEILVYLHRNEKATITNLITDGGLNQRTTYSAIEKLQSHKLVRQVTTKGFPINKYYKLTKKGKGVAEHLDLVDNLL